MMDWLTRRAERFVELQDRYCWLVPPSLDLDIEQGRVVACRRTPIAVKTSFPLRASVPHEREPALAGDANVLSAAG